MPVSGVENQPMWARIDHPGEEGRKASLLDVVSRRDVGGSLD
jgi:hypothetical protein